MAPSGASSTAIVGALGVATPGGEAPTTAALSAAVQYLRSLSDGGPRSILLVTDGESGCSSDSPATAIFTFPTFVLAAVAPSDTTAIATLNQMAVNGVVPQEGGANAFYTTTDDLAARLDPTRVTLASCVVPLLGPIPTGMTLAITAQRRDDSSVVTSIPHDATNGWELIGPSNTSVSLNGTSCASAKDGSYGQIFVLYQCDAPTSL